MTIEEAREFIPKEFTIACNKITIEVLEEGEDFGEFIPLRNLIKVSLSSRDENSKLVVFTKAQVQNTFYHELIHCFNYFYNTEMDEALAQTFANLICEYLQTKVD